jgi:hypothetical protein
VTSAQVAIAWAGGTDGSSLSRVRTLEQLHNLLGTLEVELPVEQLARLDQASRIGLGFPYELLQGPQGQMVYGDLEPKIDMPAAAPIRRRAVARRW